ncbi:hypothetical protein [Nonlabens antarcticus]|uniref:hypothetical protein n=1 Tax=Nonlabens antarcticus TaxID=392714 RepID=UPI001890EADD|nr:hypothetical protein [Nonlabens antarcticus]
MNEIKNKLPADPGALVIGIIAIVIILTGCCCGILSIPTLIATIIGWVWAAKSKKAYLQNPEQYVAKSYSNVNTGLIMNMIATILIALLLAVGLVFQGLSLFNPENYFDQLENSGFELNDDVDTNEDVEEIDTWEYEDSIDSTETEVRPVEVKEMTDSIDNN